MGDPLKDTSGPSLNILIKFSAILSLVFVPFFEQYGGILLKFMVVLPFSFDAVLLQLNPCWFCRNSANHAPATKQKMGPLVGLFFVWK